MWDLLLWTVLRIWDPGWKKIRYGIPDKHLASYFRELSTVINFLGWKYLNFLLPFAEPYPGSCAFLTWDPGRKNSDPQHWFWLHLLSKTCKGITILQVLSGCSGRCGWRAPSVLSPAAWRWRISRGGSTWRSENSAQIHTPLRRCPGTRSPFLLVSAFRIWPSNYIL